MALQRNIIIVDDSPTFCDGLKFFVENILGHRVISTASNGLEFLDLPNLSDADLILMDIEMPKMNGIIAAQKALKNYPLKIIAITNYDEKAYLKKLKDAGFKGFIAKKNIHQHLAGYIENVCNGDFAFPTDIKH